jgi:mannose-6-phosphate isomerase-like protein (cupin superfamily)
MRIITLEHADTMPISDRGTKYRLLSQARDRFGMDLNVNLIKPNTVSGKYHLHTKSDSIYFVLEGTARLQVNGKTFDVSKHTLFQFDKEEPHSIANGSDCNLLLLEMYIPGDPDFVTVKQ